MTDGNFSRRLVDDAIDRAVRETMQVDPPPGLRRRVLARLERRAHAPGLLEAPGPWLRRFRGSFFLLPAAAAIAMILAIVLPGLRQSSPPGSAPPTQVASSPPREVAAAPTPIPAPAAAVPQPVRPAVTAAARRASIFGERRDRVSASSVQEATLDEEPFPPATPEDGSPGLGRIVMMPLAEVSEIRVRPIEIRAITLPALLPPR